MGIVIDTQVLVALVRTEGSLEIFLERFSEEDMVGIAAITASELLYGVYRANTPARQRRRQEFVEGTLTRLPTLPFDLEAARIYARIWAGLTSRGQTIEALGPNDLLIGSTALAQGCAVLTENVRDFSLIDGLRVVQPSW